MTDTPSAQSPSPSTAATGTSVSSSTGAKGGNKGGRGGKRSQWSRGPPAAQSGQSQSPPASGSQGAGQDRTKGKGKGKQRQHSKSSSTGQPQADNLHEKAQELKIENGTEESNEEVCFICAEPVKYYSVSACNHRTCHVCALRLRALYKKLDCTFCKEPQQSVVFTESPDKPYEEYDLGSMPHRDSKLSVFFETQEMMEETLILLRFNCPDPDCDYIGNGWGDLKLHTRAVHNRLMCDLCIRSKKVFTHEHALYPPSTLPLHLPSMFQRHRQNAPKDQIEGGVHPMCEFCRECFFGDDELYAHCRERHEECFVCKRNDIRNQYFQDYNNLEQHFHEVHYPCTQSQCLARKFVVFGTLLDLKAHMVEGHGEDMSSRDKKDARRVVADFAFQSRRNPHHQYERAQERGREGEPPPSWPPPGPTIIAGPVPRQSQATGQNKRREAFGARLTVDDATTIGESSILASQPAIESNRTPTPTRDDVDPAVADRHGALISRLQSLAPNPTTAIPAAKAAMRGYRLSESSARDLISTIWNIVDRNLEHTASIVNAFVDLLEEEEKKQDLLASWKGFAIEQRRQFPELVPTAVGGNYAAIATGRVLNAKHSTMARSSRKSSRAVWDRVAQAAGSSMATQPSAAASSSQFPTLERFPPLSTVPPPSNHPAIRPPSQNQRTTPWTSSGVSNAASYGATGPSTTSHSMAENKVQVVAPPPRSNHGSRQPQRPPKFSSAQFPELPTASTTKQKAPVSGNVSLRNILGASPGPAVAAWQTGPAGAVEPTDWDNGEGVEGTATQGGPEGKGKKGKGKQKQTLFTLGSFPS